MTILETFRLIASEFSTTSDADVAKWISLASLKINRNLYLSQADLSTALMAAHMMKTLGSNATGAKGAVVAERVGDISVNYANPTKDSEELARTSYGLQLIQIKRTVFTSPLVV